jgi:hypothetical protein
MSAGDHQQSPQEDGLGEQRFVLADKHSLILVLTTNLLVGHQVNFKRQGGQDGMQFQAGILGPPENHQPLLAVQGGYYSQVIVGFDNTGKQVNAPGLDV